MHRVDDRLGEEPAGHTRLVRDQYNGKAGSVEHADRVDRPRKQLDAFRSIEVADLLDDGAVAVEENGAFEASGFGALGSIGHSIPRVAARTSAALIPRIHM